MHKVNFYLKSGQTLSITCDNFIVKKNSSNELVEVEWENAKPGLMHIDLKQIAFITDEKLEEPNETIS
jgi:hypothetical protein